MNFPSIDIQGSIISPDLLGKIRSEQANFQQGKDFGKDFTNAKLKDEISSAWQDAKGQWTIFQNKLSRLQEGETGTTETRNFWIVPLLSNLGYNLSFSRQAEELNGKTFPIAYRDSQIDGFPVYIGGFNESLDKRPENRQLRVSPHAMVQEYLNYSEHLYGLVTNGRQIRLLRDASRITRLSYVEFNLQKMMEEDLYSDFLLLYRLLHVSRMPLKIDGGAESIIEKYHQEGLEAGSTIRSKLGSAVKETIKALANGFINHPDNEIVRLALQQGQLDADEYYRQQLRIIYRLLFLFVIEERNLVYAESKTPETKRFSQIYFNYYSLLRLRKLAKKLPPPDANRHYDLWQSLLSSFALFETNEMGEKLGIMSLQGDLFGPGSIATASYDLHDCRLSNALVLQIIKALSYFENQNNLQIAVNYGGLDVEEFGSVYEGLLELKLEIKPVAGTGNYSCSYAGSEERSKSGSHYTPDELVQPLIKHSLDYLLDERKKIITDIITRLKLFGPAFRTRREELVTQHIYSLKVCDVACGSGHLLISGARRIAEVAASIIEEEEQPNPKAFQLAKRNAILNCIYGVDKNPLAVELCKVALWLEAYVPGQPLNFLDHHIKCGDAIVGLAHRDEMENGIADEAFKTLPGDEAVIATAFRNQNRSERKLREAEALQFKVDFEKTTVSSVQEAMVEYKTFNRLPETTPDEIDRKTRAYKKFIAGKGFTFLKAMADTQVAQFFIPKTLANKEYLMTDADFRQILSGFKGWQDRKVAKAAVVALQHRFFHWFLEFPEVFVDGGFDSVLGNPPYLNGLRITSNYGDYYYNYLKIVYSPVERASDFVSYFFRRIFQVITDAGFMAIITTNSISQSDTRTATLEYVTDHGAQINFAYRNIKWIGKAGVNVSLLSLTKSRLNKIRRFIDGKEVDSISSFLDDQKIESNPEKLYKNLDKCFQGTIILGNGFILSGTEVQQFIQMNPHNKKVIYKYINGNDLNSRPDHSPSRWVINFHDWNKEKCEKEFPELFSIVKERVKPQRDNVNRQVYRENYWLFAEKSVKLYKSIEKNKPSFVIAIPTQAVKNVAFTLIEQENVVFSNALAIIPLFDMSLFAQLSSTIHDIWIWKFCSTMRNAGVRYSPTDGFQTFPFIWGKENELFEIGDQYYNLRSKLLRNIMLGLTDIVNLFHCHSITEKNFRVNDKQIETLQRHLVKSTNTVSFEVAIQSILILRNLHVEMDSAILKAYDWQDVELRHDFYEVDYLPENDRIRFTIHPDARKEILKRLLELNHRIHAEEVAAGLWDKKSTKTKAYKIEDKEAMMVKEREKGLGDLFEQEI